MKGSLLFAVVCILTVLLGSGCTVIHSEAPDIPEFSRERCGQGTVHFTRVLKELGPPTKLSRLGRGMVWLYEDVDLVEGQVGLSFTGQSMSLFKLSLGAGGGTYAGQLFVFDGAGDLVFAGRVNEDLELGSGVAFQFIFVVTSLVDMDDMKMSGGQNSWGEGLLKELPAGLNRGQDLEGGQEGVSLKVMPEFTGQDSLAGP